MISHYIVSHFLSSFFFNNPAIPVIYTLSLHDALPISPFVTPAAAKHFLGDPKRTGPGVRIPGQVHAEVRGSPRARRRRDRKSTRLNSSHVSISYAVFCLKKKKK